MHYNKILMIQEHVKVKREYELTDCAGFAVTSHGRSVITGRDQAQKMDLLGNSNLDRVGREKIQIWPCIHKGLKYGQSVKTIEHLTLDRQLLPCLHRLKWHRTEPDTSAVRRRRVAVPR